MTNSLPSAQLFDPATGRFTATAGGLQWARQQHVMVALPDGGALVFSGVTMIDGVARSNSQVEHFDPRTGAFQIVFSAVDTSIRAVPLPDGRIALFDAPQPYQVTGNIAMYDVAAKTLTTKPLPYAVSAALLLDDGRILLSGAGLHGDWAGTFDPRSGELIDAPRLGSWSPSVVLLPDGRVLLAGGFAAPEPSDNAGSIPTVLPPAVPTVQIFQ
jgi:hypothetical protein